MKIYVNDKYEVLALDSVPGSYYKCFETSSTREELFNGYCDTCIRGYRYAPIYQMSFDENGNSVYDESGDTVFVLDESGNKIETGYSCYPYISVDMLNVIQIQNDLLEKTISQIEYLSMMSSIETEVADE